MYTTLWYVQKHILCTQLYSTYKSIIDITYKNVQIDILCTQLSICTKSLLHTQL